MAKFYDVIGYGEAVETVPGVYEDRIVEKYVYGDVIRNTRRMQSGENLNNNLTVGNSISIVADAYAWKHFHNIRYIKWAGALWTVSDVEEVRPRLILRLKEVYNGPTPPATDTP